MCKTPEPFHVHTSCEIGYALAKEIDLFGADEADDTRCSVNSHRRRPVCGSSTAAPGATRLNFLIFRNRAPVTPSNSPDRSSRKAGSAASCGVCPSNGSRTSGTSHFIHLGNCRRMFRLTTPSLRQVIVTCRSL